MSVSQQCIQIQLNHLLLETMYNLSSTKTWSLTIHNCNLSRTLGSNSLLPPAMKLGQGYIFTGICDSVHRGECLVWGLPGLGGPVCSGRCLVWGVCLVLGGLLLRGAWSRSGVLVPGGLPGGDPPGKATAAGGTHPTGMHSCYLGMQLKYAPLVNHFLSIIGCL